jgi:hypothetical protein
MSAGMELTQVQDFAIQARVAAIIGASVFDRLFAGVRFAEADGPLLYVLYIRATKRARQRSRTISHSLLQMRRA